MKKLTNNPNTQNETKKQNTRICNPCLVKLFIGYSLCFDGGVNLMEDYTIIKVPKKLRDRIMVMKINWKAKKMSQIIDKAIGLLESKTEGGRYGL